MNEWNLASTRTPPAVFFVSGTSALLALATVSVRAFVSLIETGFQVALWGRRSMLTRK